MGRGRSRLETGYLAALTRDVGTSDTSIYVDTDLNVATPMYLSLDPMGTYEVIYVDTVNDIGGGEYELTDLVRNLPDSAGTTHLTGQFVISAFTPDAHNDLWDAHEASINQTRVVSGTLTLADTDSNVMVDVTSAEGIITLPLLADFNERSLVVTRYGTGNSCTIQRQGADVIRRNSSDAISVSLTGDETFWSAMAVDAYGFWFTVGDKGVA
jgi:hypothetical protein